MGHIRTIVVSIPTGIALTAASAVAFSTPAQAATNKCVHEDDGITVCNTIDSKVKKKYKEKYSSSVTNHKKYAITGHCTSKVTKTTKFSVSVTVGAEFKAWIFAKVNVAVTGGVEHSVTTEYGSSVDFKVKAHDEVTCEYGTYVYVVKGHQTTYKNGKVLGTKKWTATAPKRNGWKVY